MLKRIVSFVSMAGLILALACSSKTNKLSREALPKVDVKIVQVKTGDMADSISFTGKTVYLKKSTILSPISGNIEKVYFDLGQKVQKSDPLYEISTREWQALQSRNSGADSSTNYGKVKVSATVTGIINSADVLQTGQFISESSSLCTIVSDNNLLIQANVPYKYHMLFKKGINYRIKLPDGKRFAASHYLSMPDVDPVSQTQVIYLKPNSILSLPENLNVEIEVPDNFKKNIQILPVSCLLSNETQDEFWIMKVFGDTLAIKVVVEKGIINSSEVEILSPVFVSTDKIISEGAYGLPDSTIVQIKN